MVLALSEYLSDNRSMTGGTAPSFLGRGIDRIINLAKPKDGGAPGILKLLQGRRPSIPQFEYIKR